MKKLFILILSYAVCLVACTTKSQDLNEKNVTMEVTVEAGTGNPTIASLPSDFCRFFGCNEAALQQAIANSIIKIGYMDGNKFVHYSQGQTNLEMPFDENGAPAVMPGQQVLFRMFSEFPWEAEGTTDFSKILEIKFDGSEGALAKAVGKTISATVVFRMSTDVELDTYSITWKVSIVEAQNIYTGTAEVVTGGQMTAVTADYDGLSQYLGYKDWTEYSSALNAQTAKAYAGDGYGYNKELLYTEGKGYCYDEYSNLCVDSQKAYSIDFVNNKFNVTPKEKLTKAGPYSAFVCFENTNGRKAYMNIKISAK